MRKAKLLALPVLGPRQVEQCCSAVRAIDDASFDELRRLVAGWSQSDASTRADGPERLGFALAVLRLLGIIRAGRGDVVLVKGQVGP